MAQPTDPFDRAVARESRLRDRAARLDTRSGLVSFVIRWFAAMAAGWALVLAGHWVFLAEPRWLVTLHSVLFALMVGYWLIAAAFVTVLSRRRPDLFGDG